MGDSFLFFFFIDIITGNKKWECGKHFVLLFRLRKIGPTGAIRPIRRIGLIGQNGDRGDLCDAIL
jgi:hypothetical protein